MLIVAFIIRLHSFSYTDFLKQIAAIFAADMFWSVKLNETFSVVFHISSMNSC